jgi:adenylate kinase
LEDDAMTMNFIMFGPPGAGKGTYSSRIAPKLGIVKISTGDIFRELVKKDTPVAREVREIMNAGGLQRDDLTIQLLKEELEKPEADKGFILDGFPRTIEQAKALEGITKIDAIINLIVPEEILVEKLSARRICKDCGDIYNVADIDREVDGERYILPPMSPKEEGKCDKCGGELIQREDDKAEAVKTRLEVYKEQSLPVKEFYNGKVQFVDVHVTRGPEVMVDKIIDMLKEAKLVE